MEETTLDNIKELGNIQKNIYNELNDNESSLKTEQKQERLHELSSISKVRNSLLNELEHKYDNLRERNANIQNLSSAVNDKQRMLEINTYFGKQYTAHTGVVMIIVYTLLAIFAVAFVKNLGLLSMDIVNILVAVIIVVGATIVFFRVSDLSNRNNMDYDKYDWPDMTSDGTKLKDYVPPEPPLPVGGESACNDLETCLGEKCCGEGTTYDEASQQCIQKNGDLETFVNQNRKYSKNVMPFSEEHNCASV